MQDRSKQVSPTGATVDLITTAGGENAWLDQGFTWLVRSFACGTVAVLFWMSWIIFKNAQPAIQKYGLDFLWGQQWDVAELTFGALPYIYGTLVSSAIAIILAVPVGLAVALVTQRHYWSLGNFCLNFLCAAHPTSALPIRALDSSV